MVVEPRRIAVVDGLEAARHMVVADPGVDILPVVVGMQVAASRRVGESAAEPIETQISYCSYTLYHNKQT
jgi:hypothetical protein